MRSWPTKDGQIFVKKSEGKLKYSHPLFLFQLPTELFPRCCCFLGARTVCFWYDQLMALVYVCFKG